jgi:hypothetical protein
MPNINNFYRNDIEYNKFFKKKKKISFDINDRFLQIIDDLAKLTKNNRTLLINSLIGQGISPSLKMFEKTWKGYLDEGIWDKKVIGQLLSGLKKIKKSYYIKD